MSRVMERTRHPIAAVASLAGSALLLYAFRFGEGWGYGYDLRYGSFRMSPGELAMRLNLLTLVLPASVLLAVAAALARPWRILEVFRATPRHPTMIAFALAAFTFVSSLLVRTYVLGGTEITDDENAYTFQARLVESGRLFVASPPPPFRAFLDNQFIVNDGRRYATYFVGHPVVLAFAHHLGFAKILAPLQGAFVLLLFFFVARRVLGERLAIWTAALISISPFYACLFATRLSQPTSAMFLAAFIWAMVRLEHAPTSVLAWAVAAVGVVGSVFTRPQTALAFISPMALAFAWSVLRRRPRLGLWGPVIATGIAVAGAVAFFLVNVARSGAPLSTGYSAYLATHSWTTPVGIGPSLRQLEQAVNHLQFWAFGWPLSLAFVLAYRRSPLTNRLALACCVVAGAFAVSAIPTVAHVGPVYYGEILPIVAILTASGLDNSLTWISARTQQPYPPAAVAAWPIAMTVCGAITFTAIQLTGLSRTTALTAAPYALAHDAGLDHAVVFVKNMPARALPPGGWAYYQRNADPDLSDPVLWVNDLGSEHDLAFVQWLGDRRAAFTLVYDDGKIAIRPLVER